MDPMTWVYIASLVLSLAVSIALRPRTEHAKPLSLEDFTVPTADEGSDIQVLFGKGWIANPMNLYYGNLRSEPPIKASGGK